MSFTLAPWLRQPPLPAAPPLPRALDLTLAVALAAFGFLLPFSVAGVSLLLAVLLLLALASGQRVWQARPWREPTWAIGLALLAYIALHSLLVDGWSATTRGTLLRYKELLVAPLLYALVRLCSRREVLFQGLLAGALAYAAAHWVGLGHERLAAALKPRYISAGFVFAVMAYQCLLRARASGRPAGWLAAAAFLAATVLFALQGRTGHVVLLLLMLLAAWQQAPRRWRAFAVLGVPAVALVAGLASQPVQKRLAESWQAISQPNPVPATSTEIRIELVRHGLTLARENFLLGGGYAHYARLHEDAVRRAHGADGQGQALTGAYWARTDNPHLEFVMQLAGGGVLALALFLGWLAAPLLRRRPGQAASPPELLGLVLAFAVGCLFNSLLMDFVEGHFYAALLAWLLAREADRTPA